MRGLQISIREDDLRGPEIAQLLTAHLENSALHSPPESIHALDLDSLRAPEITFWTAWSASTLLGCGGLKELDRRHGEIKSMHTAYQARGQGVGRRVLQHIVDEAARRGYEHLSLETGSMAAFAAARALYASFGFSVCAPFADYREDPYSVFMTLELTSRDGSRAEGPMRTQRGRHEESRGDGRRRRHWQCPGRPVRRRWPHAGLRQPADRSQPTGARPCRAG